MRRQSLVRILALGVGLAAVAGLSTLSAAVEIEKGSGNPIIDKPPPAASGEKPVAATPASDAAATKEPSAKDTPAKGAAAEGAADRIEKQIAGIQEKLLAIQSEELQLSVQIMKAVSAVTQSLENVDQAGEDLAKGNMRRGLPEYKQTMMAVAAQWQQFAEKFARVAALVKPLARDRDRAPPALQSQIDLLTGRVAEKQRTLQERIAETYDKVGEYRSALTWYLSVYQAVPETKRAAEKVLREKLGDLYFKVGDLKNAMAFYKALYDEAPEKDRPRNKNLGFKIADVLDKAGDLKTELALLKAIAAINVGDGGLNDRVSKLEKKIAAGGAASPANQGGGRTDYKNWR
jgi:tetratricopeptide (TPR) repeat protein